MQMNIRYYPIINFISDYKSN